MVRASGRERAQAFPMSNETRPAIHPGGPGSTRSSRQLGEGARVSALDVDAEQSGKRIFASVRARHRHREREPKRPRSTVTKAGLLRSARKDGSPPPRIDRGVPHVFLDGGGVALDGCSSFAHTGSHGSPSHRPDGSVSALPLRMRLRADRSSPGLSTGVLDPPEHAAEDAALHDRRCIVHVADVRQAPGTPKGRRWREMSRQLLSPVSRVPSLPARHIRKGRAPRIRPRPDGPGTRD